MDAVRVVESFDVIEEHGTGLSPIFRNFFLETFGLERSEETLHRRVVVAVSLAAHTRADVVDVQDVAEQLRGVLAPRSE